MAVGTRTAKGVASAPVTSTSSRITSTAIRWALSADRIATATRGIGSPHRDHLSHPPRQRRQHRQEDRALSTSPGKQKVQADLGLKVSQAGYGSLANRWQAHGHAPGERGVRQGAEGTRHRFRGEPLRRAANCKKPRSSFRPNVRAAQRPRGALRTSRSIASGSRHGFRDQHRCHGGRSEAGLH